MNSEVLPALGILCTYAKKSHNNIYIYIIVKSATYKFVLARLRNSSLMKLLMKLLFYSNFFTYAGK